MLEYCNIYKKKKRLIKNNKNRKKKYRRIEKQKERTIEKEQYLRCIKIELYFRLYYDKNINN